MDAAVVTSASSDGSDDAWPGVVASWPREEGGEFLIGGMPLGRAVTIAGGTPCYLYDRGRIRDRVAGLRARLSRRVQVHYAIKANPMPAIAGALVGLADGFDVASGGELGIALDAGMPPARIGFAGPGKSEAEIARAHAAGVLFNVESFREARILAALSDATGRPARVAIRCNLPFELKASGMKMTGGPRQFGIDADRVPEMMDFLGGAGLRFEGFHLYAGSQNLSADAIIEAQNLSYRQTLAWAALAPSPVLVANLGGGFGIPYARADRPLDIGRVVENLNRLAERAASDLPRARLVIELGRYLVGEAGLYVSRVIDRKLSHGLPFLVTDGGMHHHLAASGNFGQVLRRNFPVAINRPPGGATEIASVVGPLCTPLDLLADRAELQVADEGDLVVVFASGAYGRTASPRDFLGHPEVKEALIGPIDPTVP